MEFLLSLIPHLTGFASHPTVDITPEEDARRQISACRIKCPVLAALYRRGLLNPDAEGRCSWQEICGALRMAGASKLNALFQSVGIAAYATDDPEQRYRRRGEADGLVNIYRLNAGDGQVANPQFVNHGFGTTIRDTREDPPPNDDTPDGTALYATLVRASREKRFIDWIDADGVLEPHPATGEMRLTVRGLELLLQKMKACGSRVGEWSLAADGGTEGSIVKRCHPSTVAQGHAEVMCEWQAVFATAGMVVAFGRTDETGGEVYMTREDLVAMYLDSTVPTGWESRSWSIAVPGNLLMSMKCASSSTESSETQVATAMEATSSPPTSPLRFPKALRDAVYGPDAGGDGTTDDDAEMEEEVGELSFMRSLFGVLDSLGLASDPDPINPTIPCEAPDGVLEAIIDDDAGGVFPMHPEIESLPIVGGPVCPIDGLYELNMKRAWTYGSKTRGVPGRHRVTLLHLATFYRRVAIVAMLLDAGPPGMTEIEDGWGQSCVRVAEICAEKDKDEEGAAAQILRMVQQHAAVGTVTAQEPEPEPEPEQKAAEEGVPPSRPFLGEEQFAVQFEDQFEEQCVITASGSRDDHVMDNYGAFFCPRTMGGKCKFQNGRCKKCERTEEEVIAERQAASRRESHR